MRRPYGFLAGDLSGLPLGFVPKPGYLSRLDQFSSELVNGEDGGTWAPEDPIVIGPRGTPTITMTAGSLEGDVETVSGNSRGVEVDSIQGLVLEGGAPPLFATARTRTITIGLANFVSHVAQSGLAQNNDFLQRLFVDPVTLGIKWAVNTTNSRIVSVPLPIRAQHRGATISQIDFNFILTGNPLTMPTQMGRFRVAKLTGTSVLPLHSAGAPYDANGFYTDQAATIPTLLNGGQLRTISYVPDQNHTSLDPDTSWYILQMRQHQQNALVGSLFVSAVVTLTSIADFRQE
jgi:hypothetical protein